MRSVAQLHAYYVCFDSKTRMNFITLLSMTIRVLNHYPRLRVILQPQIVTDKTRIMDDYHRFLV